MRHGYDCSCKAPQRVLKAFPRFYVEVVCWLVEHQTVWFLEDHLAEDESAPLSAAQHRHALVDVLSSEEELGEVLARFTSFS